MDALMARQFYGPHGQAIVFNGDTFTYHSGSVLYTPEWQSPQPLYYVLDHGVAKDQMVEGFGRKSRVSHAKLDVRNTHDDTSGVIEVDNTKDEVTYRGEVYKLGHKVTFDPTLHQVIGLPVSERRVLGLWRVDDEEDAYIVLVLDGTTDIFYIDGEEAYPDVDLELDIEHECTVPYEDHADGFADAIYRFSGRELRVTCKGDTFVNSSLTRLDLEDYTIDFGEKGYTVSVARKA
jgi:hypothetical protein